MGEEATERIEECLSRLLDDPDFEALHAKLGRFNLFEAVGAVRRELDHSNFLAYLLSPNRSHGLGSTPLSLFLRAILESMPSKDRPVMTLELRVADLGDAIVEREQNNIDLLIEVPSLNLAVVIENKVDAKVGEGQLERYKQVTEAQRPDLRKLYVYLTPTGADPDHPSYVPFSYSTLANVLDDLGGSDTVPVPAETALIVRHYVEMLRRHIVPNDKLHELGRKLYERHTEALDFLFTFRPQQGALVAALQEKIGEADGLTIDSITPSAVRFVPDAWDQSLTSIRCDPKEWTHTGRALIFEVKTYPSVPGRVNLALLVGPGEAEARKRIYEAARDDPAVFQGLVKPMGLKWASIFSRELLSRSQAKGLSLEQQAASACLAWSDFQGAHLQTLTDRILEIDSGAGPPLTAEAPEADATALLGIVR